VSETSEMYPTHGEIEAAAEVFRNHGVDIHLPWEGSLDDREQELFEALREALTAAKRVRDANSPRPASDQGGNRDG